MATSGTITCSGTTFRVRNGTAVLIPALGQDTLTQGFTLDPSWNDQRCNVVVYLQDPNVQPDSSRPVYQGGIAPVMQLSGVAEKRLAAPATELDRLPESVPGYAARASSSNRKPQAASRHDSRRGGSNRLGA